MSHSHHLAAVCVSFESPSRPSCSSVRTCRSFVSHQQVKLLQCPSVPSLQHALLSTRALPHLCVAGQTGAGSLRRKTARGAQREPRTAFSLNRETQPIDSTERISLVATHRLLSQPIDSTETQSRDGGRFQTTFSSLDLYPSPPTASPTSHAPLACPSPTPLPLLPPFSLTPLPLLSHSSLTLSPPGAPCGTRA